MGSVRVGPAGISASETPEAAVERLVTAGYDACEVGFGRFWMDWEYASRLGSLAGSAGIALSIHAPLAAFLGHVEPGSRKHQMAIGMLDHSAGLAAASRAAPVVMHPGFLLGRDPAGCHQRSSRPALSERTTGTSSGTSAFATAAQ